MYKKQIIIALLYLKYSKIVKRCLTFHSFITTSISTLLPYILFQVYVCACIEREDLELRVVGAPFEDPHMGHPQQVYKYRGDPHKGHL